MSILLNDGLFNQPIDHVLEDLLVRFVINVPDEDLSSIERVFFQVEEAQWFYTDFVRALNQNLPSMKMKSFAPKILNKCPLLWKWGDHKDSLARFGAYKSTIPVRGVAMLNSELTKVVLVRGYESKSWSFPRGKISKDESDLDCAIREVREETGFDCRNYVKETDVLERTICGKNFKIFLAKGVPEDTNFEPLVRNEIAEITWFDIKSLQKAAKNTSQKFFVVSAMLKPLTRWIDKNKGLVSEKERIQQAEVRLKKFMGISSDVNMDAGRELLDILQGAKPQVDVKQPGTQEPLQNLQQQFVHMSLPSHLHEVYGGMGQMPQFFPAINHNPGEVHIMPPSDFFPPYMSVRPPRPDTSGSPQVRPPTQSAAPNSAPVLLNSKDFLSILNGPRSQKEKPAPLPQNRVENSDATRKDKNESVLRPDTPSKKITLLKRDNSNNDASGTLLSILGKKPQAKEAAETQPARKSSSNASELLGILKGKKSENETTDHRPQSNRRTVSSQSSAPSASSESRKLHDSNALYNINPFSTNLLSPIDNLHSKDNRASGELLSILNSPNSIKLAKREHQLPSTLGLQVPANATQHNPADLSAGNQILQLINLGPNVQAAPLSYDEAPNTGKSREASDEFENFENFEDLEESSIVGNQVYDSIKHKFDLGSEDEADPESREPVHHAISNGKINSAGAGLHQYLNGGKPPQSSRAGYGETYGTPNQAPLPTQSHPHVVSNNGADLLRLLKRAQ